MTARENRTERITEAIRQVFIRHWDPIGVVDDPEWPRDEYDSYIAQVYDMLTRNESTEFIARHLCFLEDRLMGLGALLPPARLNVAAKLKAIDLGRQDVV
jgi:hypothetical protein